MFTCFGAGGADKDIPTSALFGLIEFCSYLTVFATNSGVFFSVVGYFDQGEIVGLTSSTCLLDFYTLDVVNMFW